MIPTMTVNVSISQRGNGDGGGSGAGENVEHEHENKNNRYGGGRKQEFALVNPRNITITTFTGRNLHTNPYMPFNNALRRLILAQGQDGEVLLKVLDKIEKLGASRYTNEQLEELIKVYPKAVEFEIAIKTALLNWTSGIANNMVRFGICNGFDAWRKLYNKYVPLAEDLQNILIQELMAIKPVSENEPDALFNEIERITDFYAKTGTEEDLSDKWIRAAILKNIPEKIAKDLALDLRKATSADEMQSIMNIYMHDHRTGLQRGVPGPMICATIKEDDRSEEEIKPKSTTRQKDRYQHS